MTVRVLLAVRDEEIERQVRELLAESGQAQLVDVCREAARLPAAVADRKADVVLLHAELGPAPALVVLHDLLERDPAMSVVLLGRPPGSEDLAEALEGGARGRVGLPLSVTDVETTVVPAGRWGRRLRRWSRESEDEALRQVSGTVIAVAGARGGSGTTTIACRLALSALREGARVCLVDLDLQGGDVAQLLGVPVGTSVVDLAEVSDSLSRSGVEESLHRHRSGLHVLPGPEHGERAELVTGADSRRLVGLLRTAFDTVVVDCGSVVTDANLGAVELADRVLVVLTPELAAVHATHRLTDLWTRVQAREPGDVSAVLNRVSRRRTVQPRLARRALEVELCRTWVPSRFAALEEAVNTGRLDDVPDRRLRRAWDRLLAEVAGGSAAGSGQSSRPAESGEKADLAADPDARPGPGPGRPVAARPSLRGAVGSLRSDDGAQHVEAAVVMPFLVVLVLAVLQLLLFGAGQVAAQHRAADIAAALRGEEAAVDAGGSLGPGWGEPDVRIGDDAVTVTIHPPMLVPFLDGGPGVSGTAAR